MSLTMPNALRCVALSIVVQILTIAVLVAYSDFISLYQLPASWVVTLGGAILAAIANLSVASLCRLTFPWKLANILILFGIMTGPDGGLNSTTYLLLTLLAFLLYLPAFFSQVPYFPTSQATKEKLLSLLPTDRPFYFVDLGCGFGEPLFSLAKTRRNGYFVGIDLSPATIAFAWARSLLHRNVQIRLSNIWRHPLAPYDFVYAFLAPPPMARLGEKATSEMKLGSLLISNSFEIPNWQGELIQVENQRQSTLHIYRIGTPP